MKQALIVVDIQNDFLPGGALGVPDGDAIIPVANALMAAFDLVYATQDWHPYNHCGHADRYPDKQPFETVDIDGVTQILWPRHCEQHTAGAAFAPNLRTDLFTAVIQKGTDPNIDSYSAFFDNGHRKQTELAQKLREQQVEKVYIVGLASDYCVAYTAADAVAEGFKTVIVEDGVRGLDEKDTQAAFAELRAKGVTFCHSKDLMEL